MIIPYDEVYMTDEEWVRLLLTIIRSLALERGDDHGGRREKPIRA